MLLPFHSCQEKEEGFTCEEPGKELPEASSSNEGVQIEMLDGWETLRETEKPPSGAETVTGWLSVVKVMLVSTARVEPDASLILHLLSLSKHLQVAPAPNKVEELWMFDKQLEELQEDIVEG